VGCGSIEIQIRQVELSFKGVLKSSAGVFTIGLRLTLCAAQRSEVYCLPLSVLIVTKINPGCCRSLLFVISRGSFVFWIAMICISGCDHLYLPEKLGSIVLPSNVGQCIGSCTAGRWVQGVHSRRSSPLSETICTDY
jgi:hypothetical protein